MEDRQMAIRVFVNPYHFLDVVPEPRPIGQPQHDPLVGDTAILADPALYLSAQDVVDIDPHQGDKGAA